MKHRDPIRYPWNEWLKLKKGKTLFLRRGKHFNCMTHSMAIQVRNASAARGIRVSVSIQENGLLVTGRGRI